MYVLLCLSLCDLRSEHYHRRRERHPFFYWTSTYGTICFSTGITLSLILYELSRDQDLQRRVRAELTGDGHITFEGLQNGKAPVLDAVIKEVLRC